MAKLVGHQDWRGGDWTYIRERTFVRRPHVSQAALATDLPTSDFAAW